MNTCTVIARPYKVQWEGDFPWGPSDCATYHFSRHAAEQRHKQTPGSRLFERDPFRGEVHSFDGNPWTEIKMTTV